jgi:glycosyltransferase involved in cell wall biosynthesis
MVKISVIMSAFNEEKFIKTAVESILAQTFSDFEFIIINDGSMDQTQQILDSYIDPRILIFNQQNRGLTASLNRAIKLSKGIYIARMDGNDISLPNRLQLENDFLDTHLEVGVVGSFGIRMDEDGQDGHLVSYKTSDIELRSLLWKDCPLLHTSVMFRRECVKLVGGYREKIGPAEDLDLWMRISERYQMANIGLVLHKFRIDPNGISIKRRFDQIQASKLARHMAKERKMSGNDSLILLTNEQLDEIREKLFPYSRRNRLYVQYQNNIYVAEIFYCSRSYFKSFLWVVKAIILKPFSLRSWLLVAKIIVRVLPNLNKIYAKSVTLLKSI